MSAPGKRKTKRARGKNAKTAAATKNTNDAHTENAVSSRDLLLEEMRAAGFVGTTFVDNLQLSTANRIKREKPPRLNRYVHYCSWAHALMRKEIGPPDAEFAFPESVLAYLRFLVPGDIKGEIREDAYKVTMEQFCQALELTETT